MEKQKLLGYMRVSSREQNEARQRIALLEMGVPQNQIYMDKQSGKDFDRPQYKRLLRKLDSNSILFIKSIDRLGRNYADLNEQWRIITKEKGADIVVIDMPILDTRQQKNLLGTLISDIILSLLSYFSESERHAIKQRQAEGIAAAHERGVKFGRPPKPLPDNFEQMCKEWRERKITIKQAAKACNMAPSTFYNKVKSDEKKELLLDVLDFISSVEGQQQLIGDTIEVLNVKGVPVEDSSFSDEIRDTCCGQAFL